MKHISNLILTNFQQWKKGDIQFKEGLNVIVGNTESGKSTLFRAIGSILTGKMPEDYIRKGTKGCEVEIKFNDETTFKRSRTKKDNIANANGTIFERVGKEIPFEYFNKLGKTSIEFGSKELSLCSYSQFEPHFFITLSDYDKSKLIGTICGIDIVDKIVDAINKDIRNNNANIKFLDNKIKEQTEQHEIKEKEFKMIDFKHFKLLCCIESLKQNYKKLEELTKLQTNFNSLNFLVEDVQKNINSLNRLNFDSNKSNKLQKLFSLQFNLQIYNKIENDIKNQLSKITLQQIDINKTKQLNILFDKKQKLMSYINQIKEINENLMKINSNIEYLETEKRTLLADYDKCPLCGGIL